MLRSTMPTVGDAMPDFCAELTALVASSAHPHLAQQLAGLPLVDRCRCGQDNCAHFYTAPRPEGAFGPGHCNVRLTATRGLVVLDIVGDGIVAVEVLGRSDVKRRLDVWLPLRRPASPTLKDLLLGDQGRTDRLVPERSRSPRRPAPRLR